MRVGEVVLIHDDSPRINWRMGIITELLPSSDNHTRSVKLKTSNGSLVRTINKLYPLELRSVDSQITPMCKNIVENISRPRRLAAIKALEKIKS